MEKRYLVFDMDGTIADLYGVEGWLDMLTAERPDPYMMAKPMYDMDRLSALLRKLKAQGWTIIITTWLAKNSSPAYDAEVRTAKKEWLWMWDFPYDEIHLVKYGTTKANCTRHHGGFQILVDDNSKVRKGWTLGDTIDANEDIIPYLERLAVVA